MIWGGIASTVPFSEPRVLQKTRGACQKQGRLAIGQSGGLQETIFIAAIPHNAPRAYRRKD
jgi:hypothetical protein